MGKTPLPRIAINKLIIAEVALERAKDDQTIINALGTTLTKINQALAHPDVSPITYRNGVLTLRHLRRLVNSGMVQPHLPYDEDVVPLNDVKNKILTLIKTITS